MQERRHDEEQGKIGTQLLLRIHDVRAVHHDEEGCEARKDGQDEDSRPRRLRRTGAARDADGVVRGTDPEGGGHRRRARGSQLGERADQDGRGRDRAGRPRPDRRAGSHGDDESPPGTRPPRDQPRPRRVIRARLQQVQPGVRHRPAERRRAGHRGGWILAGMGRQRALVRRQARR